MISQRKIAEYLGMPTSTVANILNGTPYYKKETRERVLKAAAELGYRKNRASLAVKRGRSNLIGVVHFGSSYETAQQAISHLVDSIRQHEYDFIISDKQWHAGDTHRMLQEMIEARVEGVILIGNGTGREAFDAESLALLRRAGIPVVSLYGDDNLDVPFVGDSSQASFYAMARHLQKVGHRSIILPSLPSEERSTLGRIVGLQLAMQDVGPCHVLDEADFIRRWPRLLRDHRDRPFAVVVRFDMNRHDNDLILANYHLSRQLFASGSPPDALMCANDRAACGVFNAAYVDKIRIPEDIAVTGADNDQIGAFPMFRLTTIRLNIPRSSQEAVDMLMQCLKGKKVPTKGISFPSQLVLRQSCGRMVGFDEPAETYVDTPSCDKLPSLRKIK